MRIRGKRESESPERTSADGTDIPPDKAVDDEFVEEDD